MSAVRVLPALLWIAAMGAGAPAPDEIEIPVPRPEQIVGLNLGGAHSCYVINGHYTTGWAHYVETVPARRLLDGIGVWGVVPENAANCEDFFRRCSQVGLRHVRWEIGWGSGQYRADLSEPYRLQPHVEEQLLAGFRASKEHGVRILILLNAHQGMPCPTLGATARFAADAKTGDTDVVLALDRPEVLKEGYSGISNLTYYCAAEGLFKTIEKADEGTYGKNVFAVTLSKPLPWDAPKGKDVPVHTLQFRPFGDAQTDAATYAGWADHAGRLAELAREAGLEDGDVDFELWNELTFGTGFLSIARYDAGVEGEADHWKMLELGAAAIRARFPEKSQVINGFSNTTFFFGGQFIRKYPDGVSAESYHPYGFGVYEWPEFARKRADFMYDSRNVDGFVPSYVTCFPEQHGNYLLSHTLICLMRPEMREQLRARDGMVAEKFMTECGTSIAEYPEPYRKAIEEAGTAEHVRAKFCYRLYPFYMNKGLRAVDDSTMGQFEPDKALAAFLCKGDDSHMEAWRPVQRMANLLEPLTTPLRDEPIVQLQFKAWTADGDDGVIYRAEDAWAFEKDVAPKTMCFRDALCLLPFQLNATDFAVAAYVQTRNILEDHDDCGTYRIQLPQLHSPLYDVSVHDPFRARPHPFRDVTEPGGPITVSLALPDYPVWIVLRKWQGRDEPPAP